MPRNTGDETEAMRADNTIRGASLTGASAQQAADPEDGGLIELLSLAVKPFLKPGSGVREPPSRPDGEQQPSTAQPMSADESDQADLAQAPKYLSLVSLGIVTLTIAFAVLSIVIVNVRDEPRTLWWGHQVWTGAAFAGVVWAFMLLVLHISDARSAGKGYGIFRPVIGKDDRWSTSLTQLALWTVAIGIALSWCVGMVVFADRNINSVFTPAVWDQYLLLLGGPFAAAVLAKGVIQYKTENGSVQKVEPPPESSPTPSQIYKADGGGGDLVDAQYLLFNLIALGYFVVQFESTGALPMIPGPLLALTGGAAALYSANKAVASNAPSITSVAPRTVRPGDTVTVFGVNFVPAGDDNAGRQVTATITGCTEAIPTVEPAEPTRVRFRIPASAQAGDKTIRVTSTAGVQTAPQDLEVRSDAPIVYGLNDESRFRPGADVTLRGERLGRDGDAWAVKVGGVHTQATVKENGMVMSFRAPGAQLLDANDVTLELTGPGGETATITVEIARPHIVAIERDSSNDQRIRVTVEGVGVGSNPTYIVNDRIASAPGSDNPRTVLVPVGIDPKAEMRVRVADGLGLRSAELILGATN